MNLQDEMIEEFGVPDTHADGVVQEECDSPTQIRLTFWAMRRGTRREVANIVMLRARAEEFLRDAEQDREKTVTAPNHLGSRTRQ